MHDVFWCRFLEDSLKPLSDAYADIEARKKNMPTNTKLDLISKSKRLNDDP